MEDKSVYNVVNATSAVIGRFPMIYQRLYNLVNPTSAVIGRLDQSLYNVVNATRAVATELVLPLSD